MSMKHSDAISESGRFFRPLGDGAGARWLPLEGNAPFSIAGSRDYVRGVGKGMATLSSAGSKINRRDYMYMYTPS